jgi:hypothetical protein
VGYVLLTHPTEIGSKHWATDDLAMDESTRLGLAERTWAIENYHRG